MVGLSALNLKTKMPAAIGGYSYTRNDTTTGAGARVGLGYRHHIGRISVQAEFVHTKGFGDVDKVKLNTMEVGANFSF